MGILDIIHTPVPVVLQKFNPTDHQSHTICSKVRMSAAGRANRVPRLPTFPYFRRRADAEIILIGAAGFVLLSFVGPCYASESPFLNEPSNALSLPTWAIHVSSVAEWVTAMALVWQYGEKSGFESWKGLSWGMVPLLGGAFCACTWHFFYNAESLEILVALQAALTVIGNVTMCIAAYRIYISSLESSKKF